MSMSLPRPEEMLEALARHACLSVPPLLCPDGPGRLRQGRGSVPARSFAARPTARNEFWVWATKYVFDTLEAGRSWHPADREPAGAAFLPMMEAEETYRESLGQGPPCRRNGFSAQWSPDGKKLAFSLGVHGYSGVAVFDPATKETELLIVPGKDPRWSPDGQYIAFVRDCQALRLEELTATERKEQGRWLNRRRSLGHEIRWHRTRGGWPGAAGPRGVRTPHSVYYHSRLEKMLCSISIAGLKCRTETDHGVLRASLSLGVAGRSASGVSGRRIPQSQGLGFASAWLPNGVCHSAPGADPHGLPRARNCAWAPAGSVGDRTGLWIYPLDSNEPAKVLTQSDHGGFLGPGRHEARLRSGAAVL